MDEELLKKILAIKKVEDPSTASLVMAELLAPGSSFLNELAHDSLDAEILAKAVACRVFSKVSEDADGSLRLGLAPEDLDQPVGLYPIDFTRLVLILGTPGSGKTTFIRNLLSQLITK